MRVISYNNGEEWMSGRVVCFTADRAVVECEESGFLNTLAINSLKVINEKTSLEEENEKLKKAIKIAREKLGYYASGFGNDDEDEEFSMYGKRARQALKEIKSILKDSN